MLTRPTILLMVLALSASGAALAACGDDDEDSDSAEPTGAKKPGETTSAGRTETARTTPGGVQRLSLVALERGAGRYAFSRTALSAGTGQVTITMANPSGNLSPHGIEVEGQGVEEEGKTVDPGATSTVTVDLKQGSYEFYCPVDDHKNLGMEGTLKVR